MDDYTESKHIKQSFIFGLIIGVILGYYLLFIYNHLTKNSEEANKHEFIKIEPLDPITVSE